MSDGTEIEWTHRPGTVGSTMNALVGCQKVSEGCRNCYAIGVAHVRAGNPLPVMQEKFGGTTKREGGNTLWTGKVTVTEKALLAPLRTKKPHTYFVNSMSDLWYDGVPDEVVDQHMAVFALCPQHTFIVLTKRPERMRAYCSDGKNRHVFMRLLDLRDSGAITAKALTDACDVVAQAWPLPNVWLGTSVEDQATADARIPELLQTPAAVRFISAEPLLASVDLRSYVGKNWWQCSGCGLRQEKIGSCKGYCQDPTGKSCDSVACPRCGKHHYWTGSVPPSLDWVIVGGESGAGARPMHPDWARSLRDQCAAAGVPFFFKQWGENLPFSQVRTEEQGKAYSRAAMRGEQSYFGACIVPGPQGMKTGVTPGVRPEGYARMPKKLAGHLLDGVEHRAFPEVSA